MTRSLPASARVLLDSPALAHLVTLNPDGSPQVTVVWVGLDGDEIVAAHLPEHRKVRTIRNDSRVALSIETDTRNPMGLNELTVYNTVRDYNLASKTWSTLAPLPSPRHGMAVAVVGNTIYAIDGAFLPLHNGSTRTLQYLTFRTR